MNTFDIIKHWDDYLVEQHVGSELAVIIDYFQKKEQKNLIYLDIGANCGKYYDVLSRYFTIDLAIMAEASKHLYEYLLIKFNHNNKCTIYNSVLSDNNDDISFSDIDFSYITDINNINLGLSKVYNSIDNKIKQTSANDFFNTNVLEKNISHLDLIKIDTENRDYHILKSMTECISKLKNKPLICFEHNYHNDMTKDEAQDILKNFCSFNNYEYINIDNIKWSSVFLWP